MNNELNRLTPPEFFDAGGVVSILYNDDLVSGDNYMFQKCRRNYGTIKTLEDWKVFCGKIIPNLIIIPWLKYRVYDYKYIGTELMFEYNDNK